MTELKVSDQIALFLKNNNIEVVFGIIGAGVAGLSATGTANSLGAIVRAFDTRPDCIVAGIHQ